MNDKFNVSGFSKQEILSAVCRDQNPVISIHIGNIRLKLKFLWSVSHDAFQ